MKYRTERKNLRTWTANKRKPAICEKRKKEVNCKYRLADNETRLSRASNADLSVQVGPETHAKQKT